MFAVKDIYVWFGRIQILQNIRFIAHAGQVTAIVGPNGSGKTTLLRAMTGEVSYSGAIRLEGTDIKLRKPWELAARRAVLPQSIRIAFPFTVLEVVRLGLIVGINAADDSLPFAALARVGLSGFEGRYYNELSGGEQQRVQLARVLVQVWEPLLGRLPCWLLLDEPVASLDMGHQLEVMGIVRDFATRGGGVIAVMHDLNLTSMFADSVALMKNGKLVDQGKPVTILNDENLTKAYDCPISVNTLPGDSTARYILPQAVLGMGARE